MGPAFISNIQKAMAFCDSKGIPIIHVVTEYTEERMPLLNRQKGLKIFMKGTPGAEEIEEVKETSGAKHLRVSKAHYDSFYQTGLDDLLDELGVDTLLITGLYTHWCVLATVFSAYSRNYHVHVIRECVASHHPELDRLLFEHVYEKSAPAMRVISLSDLERGE